MLRACAPSPPSRSSWGLVLPEGLHLAVTGAPLELEARRAHDRLRDARGRVVARSGKVGFCLVNSLPVDLRLERPRWTFAPPFGGDCGARRPSMRIDPGWGDLYYQDLPGQSLDLRRVRNGAYRLEVVVDPARAIRDANRANQVAGRPIVLGGSGRRSTLALPAVGGIDIAAELRATTVAGTP